MVKTKMLSFHRVVRAFFIGSELNQGKISTIKKLRNIKFSIRNIGKIKRHGEKHLNFS